MTDGQYDHNDIMRQLAIGGERFRAIDQGLSEINKKLDVLPQLQQDIAETKEIVEAWGALKALGKFFKWVSGAIAGVLAIVAVAKAASKGWI